MTGYVSYREESEGTWFIKALSLTFMRDAHECHVDRLLQIVTSTTFWLLRRKLIIKQMCSFYFRSMSKYVIGLERKTGSKLWKLSRGASIVNFTSTPGSGNDLYTLCSPETTTFQLSINEFIVVLLVLLYLAFQ